MRARGPTDPSARTFTGLRSRADHAHANRALAALFRTAGARRQRSRLYEGVLTTLYAPGHDIWLAAHRLHNRYRNALGVGDPAERRELSPSIQLNLALAPGGARPQARFLRDEHDQVWIGHTGTLGGRQAGISRHAFLDFVGGARETVIADRREPLLLLGTYARPEPLLDAIAHLVHAAFAFRSAVAAGAIGRGPDAVF